MIPEDLLKLLAAKGLLPPPTPPQPLIGKVNGKPVETKLPPDEEARRKANIKTIGVRG